MCKKVINIVLTVLLLFFCAIPAYATSLGFETSVLSEEKISEIWEYIELEKISEPFSMETCKEPIVSFDVSESGEVLLALNNNEIVVLDADNTPQYYFRFFTYGNYRVCWQGENILLFLVRSDNIVEFSLDGEQISITNADCSKGQNNRMWNELRAKKQIKAGEYTYTARNQMGFLNNFVSSYAQLVKTNSKESSVILYDVSSVNTTKTFLCCFAVMSVIMVVVIKLIYPLVRQIIMQSKVRKKLKN